MCINGISPDFSFGSLWIFGLKCPMRITSSLSLWPKKKYDFLWREMGSGFLCSGNGGKIRDLFSGIQNIFAIHQFLYYKNNSRGYGIYSLLKNKNWWIADISSLILLFTSSFTVIYSWLHSLGNIAVFKGFLMGLYDFLGVAAIILVCILARASFSIIESRKIYSSTCAEPAAF